jgi:hypothetical protein
MSKRLELHVHKTDGTSSVELVERNDHHGRKAIDAAAFAALQRSGVARAHAVPVDRVAMNRKGSAR